MEQVQSLVVLEEDYKKILAWLRDGHLLNAMDSSLIHNLKQELDKAERVKKENFPETVVRLNSKVTVLEKGKSQPLTFTIVAPGQASMQEKKVSILAPIATAVLGYRKGSSVDWELPSGLKSFTIKDVVNTFD